MGNKDDFDSFIVDNQDGDDSNSGRGDEAYSQQDQTSNDDSSIEVRSIELLDYVIRRQKNLERQGKNIGIVLL